MWDERSLRVHNKESTRPFPCLYRDMEARLWGWGRALEDISPLTYPPPFRFFFFPFSLPLPLSLSLFPLIFDPGTQVGQPRSVPFCNKLPTIIRPSSTVLHYDFPCIFQLALIILYYYFFSSDAPTSCPALI